uniref:Uncharacterized protein n=1 Tax=Triticum urartu TaxID=4572 RepID=A0A8R7TF39_TRIUA
MVLIVLFDTIMDSDFVYFKSLPRVTSNPGSATGWGSTPGGGNGSSSAGPRPSMFSRSNSIEHDQFHPSPTSSTYQTC